MNIQQNKTIVVRFNEEFIEQGNEIVFNELVSENVVNHSAPHGMPNGKESMHLFLSSVLQNAFPDLKVEVLDQVGEGDLVATRKIIRGTHLGELFGISPTNKTVEINVIDIIRIRDGQYIEHWGQSNFDTVLKQIAENQI